VYLGIGDDLVQSGLDCGAWTPGYFVGCTPDNDAASTTRFTLHALPTGPDTAAAQTLTISAMTAHPGATLGTVTASCPGGLP
jgi:hypothetical protein